MTKSFQTSNFKLQTSNKLQVSKFKPWCLIFGNSLVFDFCDLNFADEGGVYG